MTSQRSVFRIFEFGSHNPKEDHELPLNVHKQYASALLSKGPGSSDIRSGIDAL